MSNIAKISVLDKVRRRHRRAVAKDRTLSALVPNAGVVKTIDGKRRAVMPTVDGSTVTYLVTVSVSLDKKSVPAPTPRERYRKAIDDAFGALIDLEQRAAATGTIPDKIAAE